MPGAVSLWMAPLAALGASTTAVLGSREKGLVARQAGGLAGDSSRPGSQWRSLLWIVRTAWTAPCCSRALWAVWFPSAGKPEPPMHAPERWPYGGSRAGGHGVITSTVSRNPNIATLALRDRADPALLRVEVGAEAAAAAAGAGAGGDREPGLMAEAGQPLGRASPDDESGFSRVSQFPQQPSLGNPLRRRRQPFVHRERSSIPMGRPCV